MKSKFQLTAVAVALAAVSGSTFAYDYVSDNQVVIDPTSYTQINAIEGTNFTTTTSDASGNVISTTTSGRILEEAARTAPRGEATIIANGGGTSEWDSDGDGIDDTRNVWGSVY